MPKSCIVCKALASPDLQLQYCAACKSSWYCSKACQKIDWGKQHKPICKLLNVGHGDVQFRNQIHIFRSFLSKGVFERELSILDEDKKRFFKLFQESTFEGSQAAARKMRTIAEGQIKKHQKFLLFHSLNFLIRSNTEMLLWPNSPLLVMLQFVDPNVLTGIEDDQVEGEERITPLHDLGGMADPSDYSTHVNQLILAKQLIEHGADVNAVSSDGETPLQNACYGGYVTNLDFIELLLEGGADPNSQNHRELTPLMRSTPLAPGAAKFLLNWPTTDVNITTRSGGSFLASVRSTITDISVKIAVPDNPEKKKNQFLLRQWREVEEMLVEKIAHDTGITAIE
jgi:hypothetical protein